MTECRRCGNPLPETGLSSLTPFFCPHCGASLYQEKSSFEGFKHLVSNYFKDVRLILTRPGDFFKQLPQKGGLSRPLTFALVTHWIGASLALLWKISISTTLMRFSRHMMQVLGDVLDYNEPGTGKDFLVLQDRIVDWLTGVGPVLADPFFTLFSILFTSFFVFLGASILAGSNQSTKVEVTYESAIRLVCFGMTPAILAALPLFGGVISFLLVIIVTTIGAKEMYKVSTLRGVTIALFPKILFFGTIGLGLMLVIFSLLRFFSSFFM